MIVNGWLSWAERRDGIPDKVYSQPNRGEGIAMHSVVGDLPNHRIPGRFLSRDRAADGRYTASAAASCMFILYRDGHLVQMYPVTASTWTSGGFDGNTRFWAVEAEGGLNPYNEPLTKAAEDTFIRLVTEWENHTGRKAQPGVNLLQHKEIARKYGYAATACASDRYDGALVRIIAGERYRETGAEMTKEEIEKLIDQKLALAFAVDNADDVRLVHFRRLLDLAINGGEGAFADAQGRPLPLIRDRALIKAVEESTKPRVAVIPGPHTHKIVFPEGTFSTGPSEATE